MKMLCIECHHRTVPPRGTCPNSPNVLSINVSFDMHELLLGWKEMRQGIQGVLERGMVININPYKSQKS